MVAGSNPARGVLHRQHAALQHGSRCAGGGLVRVAIDDDGYPRPIRLAVRTSRCGRDNPGSNPGRSNSIRKL